MTCVVSLTRGLLADSKSTFYGKRKLSGCCDAAHSSMHGGAPPADLPEEQKLPATKKQKVGAKGAAAAPQAAGAPVKSPIKSPPLSGAPKGVSTAEPLDLLQDVALRKSRLAEHMQQYQELQQKSGHVLHQMISDIKHLDGLAITEEVLSKTEIGKTIRSISKPLKQVPPLPDMRGKAGALLNKWKGAVPPTKSGAPAAAKPAPAAAKVPPTPAPAPMPATTPAPAPAPAGPPSSAGPTQDAQPTTQQQNGVEAKSGAPRPQQPPANSQRPPANGTASHDAQPAPPPQPAGAEHPTRGKVRLILERALSPPGHVIPLATAARMIEEALHKYFPEQDLGSGEVYLRQMYVVISALKSPESGDGLRTRIAQGKLHPQDLAISTEEELYEMGRSFQSVA